MAKQATEWWLLLKGGVINMTITCLPDCIGIYCHCDYFEEVNEIFKNRAGFEHVSTIGKMGYFIIENPTYDDIWLLASQFTFTVR